MHGYGISQLPWHHLVVFALDEQLYALPLPVVERVVRVVDVTPLPSAPQIVHGVINVQGQIFPVVNIRRRFRFPERELRLSDQLLIAQTAKRTVVLLVDEVHGVIECSPQDMVTAERILPTMEYIAGVMKRENGLVLIHDLGTFLSLDEEHALDAALSPRTGDRVQGSETAQ